MNDSILAPSLIEPTATAFETPPADTRALQEVPELTAINPAHAALAAPPAEATQPQTAGTPSATAANPIDDSANLQLVIFDAHHWPIPNLPVKLLDSRTKKQLFSGVTDGKGSLGTIEGLKVGTIFEVHLRRDDGTFKMSAIGTLAASENVGNLRVPRIRFEFATYAHEGTPGLADDKKKATAQAHNQTKAPPDIARSQDKKPSTTDDRNAQGAPKTVVAYGVPNMFNQNSVHTMPMPSGASGVEKVKALIDFAMEQIRWEHSKQQTSDTIIKKMSRGVYQAPLRAVPEKGYGYTGSTGSCTKYVKIALWKAGFYDKNEDFAPLTSAAKEMGPQLLKIGFREITNEIPDARWAAPGDVIVYQKLGDARHVGHIDIRTYDGYVSDFYENYLPMTGYKVIGIYRKYFDPAPIWRMKAFLRVIRSREAETVSIRMGDAATYRALPLSAKNGLVFDSFETHPFEGTAKPGTPSGAYGITRDTWRNYSLKELKPGTEQSWVPILKPGGKFTPEIQDRIATAIMELHYGQGVSAVAARQQVPVTAAQTELGLLRKGEVEKTAQFLAAPPTRPPSAQWSSLPGGSEARGYTMEQMLRDFQQFFEEEKNRA